MADEPEKKKDATEEEESKERKMKVSALSPHQQRRDSIDRIHRSRIEDLKESGVEIEDPTEEGVPPEELTRLEAAGLVEEVEVEPEKDEDKEEKEAVSEEEVKEKEPTTDEETEVEAKEKEKEEEPPEEEMVKIKVRGEEQEVPLSQVLEAGTRYLQKETDLDKRYNEVTVMQKELKEQLESIKSGKPPATDTSEEEIETEEEDRELDFTQMAYDLQYGTEEEAAAALKALKSQPTETVRQETGLTKEDINAMLDERDIMREVNTKFRAPADQGGFADIIAHEEIYANILRPKINRMITPESEGGLGMPNTWPTYKQAGEEVRKAYGAILNPSKEPKVTVDKEEKEAKKEGKDAPTGASISSASAKTDKEKAEEKEADPSQVVKGIAQSRGQML